MALLKIKFLDLEEPIVFEYSFKPIDISEGFVLDENDEKRIENLRNFNKFYEDLNTHEKESFIDLINSSDYQNQKLAIAMSGIPDVGCYDQAIITYKKMKSVQGQIHFFKKFEEIISEKKSYSMEVEILNKSEVLEIIKSSKFNDTSVDLVMYVGEGIDKRKKRKELRFKISFSTFHLKKSIFQTFLEGYYISYNCDPTYTQYELKNWCELIISFFKWFGEIECTVLPEIINSLKTLSNKHDKAF